MYLSGEFNTFLQICYKRSEKKKNLAEKYIMAGSITGIVYYSQKIGYQLSAPCPVHQTTVNTWNIIC